MPTIDKRLRDLEEWTQPSEDTWRPADVAFMLELLKQQSEDMHLVMEYFDRMERELKGQPRIQAWPCFPASCLSDEDLTQRAAPIFDRIEAEVIKQGYTEEQLMELSETD
jgi:hypothetical protein